MRTTVTIDDRIYKQMRQIAVSEETTVGSIIEDAFRLLLAERKRRMDSAEWKFPTADLGGYLPGVDPTSNASLFAAAGDDVLA